MIPDEVSDIAVRTPEVYAIELLEFPNDIPIAKLSVGATSSLSSKLILLQFSAYRLLSPRF